MLWDHRITLVNGSTDADPIASPGTVPDAKVVELRKREPNTKLSNRLILGLHAPTGETADISVYALDDEDEEAARADRRWSLVFSATVTGGAIQQSGLAAGAAGFVGGGLFYFRVTAETITADRELVVRATS